MDKKIIEEIKKRVNLSAGHAYMSFGHMFSHQFEEAKETTEEFKDEIDSLIEYLEGLES